MREHVQWFPAPGPGDAVICLACADAVDAGLLPEVADLCDGCFGRATDGDVAGVRVPAVIERRDGTRIELSHHPLPVTPAPIIDLAHAEGAGRWLALCADGSIWRLGPGWRTSVLVATDALVAEGPRPSAQPVEPRLHVSASGAFVAVVNDHGRDGSVIDATSGAVTMRLDGGDGHADTVPFSLAFAVDGGREVVSTGPTGTAST